MKSVRAILAVLCVLAFSSSAFAGWDTYVSSSGSDANTATGCLRPAPCATFSGAFGATVQNGVIHVLDSGAYGTLTITHGVTLDGGNLATTLGSGGNLIFLGTHISINAGTATVTIQNLTISGSGIAPTAIGVTAVGGLHVQNCTFNGFTTSAINFGAASGQLEMTNVTIGDIPSGNGVYVGNGRAALDNVHINHTQTAVLAAGSSTVSIRRSTANGNGTAFVAAYGPTAELHVDDCMMTNNQWGIVVSGGARAYVSRSTLSNNFITALFNDGASTLVSFGNNQFASNASDGAFTATATMK
jgi:Right handed beta helix region